jgi:uncharacterized protein (DUF849 family)
MRLPKTPRHEAVIKAALNGGRTREEHPGVPITPSELAEAAKESVAAGAGAIHFHVRGRDSKETLEPDDVAAALAAVRAAIPGTPTGVSTGWWILKDAQLRHEMVSRWKVQPDFASVNFKEEGAVPLAGLLLSRNVPVEAGISDVAGTEILIASGFASRCFRILLEPTDASMDAALKTLEQVEAALKAGGVKLPMVLHGLNRTAWDLINTAAARGYDTRVGFEDILTLPDGTRAASNGVLVAETRRRMLRAAARNPSRFASAPHPRYT